MAKTISGALLRACNVAKASGAMAKMWRYQRIILKASATSNNAAHRKYE